MTTTMSKITTTTKSDYDDDDGDEDDGEDDDGEDVNDSETTAKTTA